MKTNDRAIIVSNLPWEGDVSITGTNHPPEHTAHHHTDILFSSSYTVFYNVGPLQVKPNTYLCKILQIPPKHGNALVIYDFCWIKRLGLALLSLVDRSCKLQTIILGRLNFLLPYIIYPHSFLYSYLIWKGCTIFQRDPTNDNLQAKYSNTFWNNILSRSKVSYKFTFQAVFLWTDLIWIIEMPAVLLQKYRTHIS